MTVSEKAHFRIGKVILVLALALGVGLGGGFLLFRQRAEPKAFSGSGALAASLPTATASEEPTVSQVSEIADYSVRPSSAEEMFSEFLCPCCGKPIADCTCGMAAERRGFVTGQVSAERSRLEVYIAYADQYGWDGFVSEVAKSAARGFKIAHAPATRPTIMLEPRKVDLGKVSTKKGKVETSVTVRNGGQDDLIVNGLSTSCACTTVSLVNNGLEGPLFGAGAQPEGWAATIPPGKSAELRIFYDPSHHKEARGAMMREVYVSSNDPIDRVAKVSIQLEQVD